MSLNVGYFLRANSDIYGVIASYLPPARDISDSRDAGTGRRDRTSARSRLSDRGALHGGYDSRRTALAANPIARCRLRPGRSQGCTAAGVPVALSLHGSSDAVAEHAILLMLAVCRRVVELSNSMKAGQWLMWDRRMQSRNLQGMTIGLIGMGRIGQEVAVRAAAFKMTVQYHDPVRVSGYRYAELDELLASSDVISLQIPEVRK